MPSPRLPAQFRIPDIALLTSSVFEFRTNPFLEQAKEFSYRWFSDYHLYEPAEMDEYFTHDYAMYASVLFPTCSEKHLRACMMFYLTGVAFDDVADRAQDMPRSELKRLLQDTLAMLRPENHHIATTEKFPCMFRDISKQILSSPIHPATYERFITACWGYAKSSLSEKAHRVAGQQPSVEEYIADRRASVGGNIAFAFAEICMGLETALPADLLSHPTVVELAVVANDIVAWANDIISFNIEQSMGDTNNLVNSIMAERDCTLDIALNELASMIRERVGDYAHLKSQLPKFGRLHSLDLDAALASYIRGVEHWAQGTIVWSFASRRYFPETPSRCDGAFIVQTLRPVEPLQAC